MITNLIVCLSVVVVFHIGLALTKYVNNKRAGKRYNKVTREYK
jgi:Sec-independent protein secretion pathway component TatC